MAWSKDPNVPELTEDDEIVRWLFRLSPHPGDRCYVCGEPAEHPAIYWSAAGGHLWFHPACARGFIDGLGQDIARYDRIAAIRDEHIAKAARNDD
jgi:hypothetical protein